MSEEKCSDCGELVNEIVMQDMILNAIQNAVDGVEPSDFELSYSIVRDVWEAVQEKNRAEERIWETEQ